MDHATNTLIYNNFGQLIVIFCLYGQTILRKVVKSGKFLMTDLTVFCCLRLDQGGPNPGPRARGSIYYGPRKLLPKILEKLRESPSEK